MGDPRKSKNVELLESSKEGEKKPPIIRCPSCGTVNLVSLTTFEQNMGAPYKFNCRQCHGIIFIALVLVANNDLVKLNRHLELLINTTNESISGQGSGLILPRK